VLLAAASFQVAAPASLWAQAAPLQKAIEAAKKQGVLPENSG